MRITAALVALVCLFTTVASPAATLAEARWSEIAYGMSLRPPAGAQVVEQTTDKALAKFIFAGDATLSVYIRSAPQPVEMDEVKADAIRQFVFLKPDAALVDDQAEVIRPAGRESRHVTFVVPAEQTSDWIASQVIMRIDPLTVAVFQLECATSQYDDVKPIFHAVLESVQMMPVDQLSARRDKLLQAGNQWLKQVRGPWLKQHLIGEQWFRLVRNGQDVGYMRVAHRVGAGMDLPGIIAEMQSRTTEGASVLDTHGEYFVSDSQESEIWAAATTRRPAAVPGRVQDTQQVIDNWAQHGVRSAGVIQVIRQTPTSRSAKNKVGPHGDTWPTPPTAYVNQAELQILPLLPHAGRPEEMLLYAYHPATNAIALRHESVRQLDDGSTLLRIRPTPESGEQQVIFDAAGQLLSWRHADGTTALPATLEQIRQLNR